MGVSYALTNYAGTTDPAGDIITLIEARLTAAGWTFVEAVPFTQSATARYMRVWKNPASLNVGGTDFYVGLVKNQVAGTYLAVRTFEGWDAVNKLILRPCLQSGTSLSNTWSGVAYGGGTWVVVAASGYGAYSTDGVTFTPFLLPNANTNAMYVAYQSGKFLALQVNNNGGWYSTDGINWTYRANIINGRGFSGLFAGNGSWLVITSGSTTWDYASGDASTATFSQQSPFPVTPSASATAVYANGTWVAALGASATGPCTSTDLSAMWTSRTINATAKAWTAVAWNGSTFVCTANSSQDVGTSTDGTNWTNRASVLPASGAWSNVGAVGSTFIAFNNNAAQAATSTDGGATWANRILPAAAGYNRVASSGSLLVVALNGMFAYTTTDGATYNSRTVTITNSNGGASLASHDLANTAVTPAFADRSYTLTASTNYDVAVLASNSYHVVAIYNNATGTQVGGWISGRFQPGYSDSQATVPALFQATTNVTLPDNGGGVSRLLRPMAVTYQWAAGITAESWPIGNYTNGVDGKSASIRGSRAIVVGNVNPSATNTTFSGWVYDCVAIGAPNTTTIKAGDQAVIGGNTYVCLGTSPNPANGYSSLAVGFFWNLTGAS